MYNGVRGNGGDPFYLSHYMIWNQSAPSLAFARQVADIPAEVSTAVQASGTVTASVGQSTATGTGDSGPVTVTVTASASGATASKTSGGARGVEVGSGLAMMGGVAALRLLF